MGEWLFGPSGLVDRPELGDHSSHQIVPLLLAGIMRRRFR
jgi:hypothetical protein